MQVKVCCRSMSFYICVASQNAMLIFNLVSNVSLQFSFGYLAFCVICVPLWLIVNSPPSPPASSTSSPSSWSQHVCLRALLFYHLCSVVSSQANFNPSSSRISPTLTPVGEARWGDVCGPTVQSTGECPAPSLSPAPSPCQSPSNLCQSCMLVSPSEPGFSCAGLGYNMGICEIK